MNHGHNPASIHSWDEPHRAHVQKRHDGDEQGHEPEVSLITSEQWSMWQLRSFTIAMTLSSRDHLLHYQLICWRWVLDASRSSLRLHAASWHWRDRWEERLSQNEDENTCERYRLCRTARVIRHEYCIIGLHRRNCSTKTLWVPQLSFYQPEGRTSC